MSNFDELCAPREDSPGDRCHHLFYQLHSLLSILVMLVGEDNSMELEWGHHEHNLFFLLQRMVEDLAHNHSQCIKEILAEKG